MNLNNDKNPMKTTVFALFGQVSFSYETFLGVYSSKEKARDAVKTFCGNDEEIFESFDSFYVYEKELDSPIEINQCAGFSVFEKNE